MEGLYQTTTDSGILPKFLLEEAFSFLEKETLCELQLVCKEWRSLMLQFIWHTVKLRDMKEGEFRYVENYGEYIRYANMMCAFDLKFGPVLSCCPNLTGGYFDVGGYDEFMELKKALAASPSIQLSTLDMKYDWPLEAPFKDPFKGFPGLEKITLDLDYTFDEEEPSELTTFYSPGIKHFTFTTDFFEPTLIEDINRTFPNLVTLVINCEGISNDEDLGALEVNFSKLRQLTLNNCQGYSMSFSKMFGSPKNLKNLSNLSFDTGYNNSSASLNEIFGAKWDNLNYLKIDLSGAMSQSIDLNHFPNLTTLDISLYLTPEDIPGKDLKLEYLSSLTKLPKLKELYVEGKLTDKLFAFTTQIPTLHRLTLNGAYHLGPNFLQWLICGINNLQTLSITEDHDKSYLFQPEFKSVAEQVAPPSNFIFPLLLRAELPTDTQFSSWVRTSSPNLTMFKTTHYKF